MQNSHFKQDDGSFRQNSQVENWALIIVSAKYNRRGGVHPHPEKEDAKPSPTINERLIKAEIRNIRDMKQPMQSIQMMLLGGQYPN